LQAATIQSGQQLSMPTGSTPDSALNVRIVTIVWGVTYLGEFILRLILVYYLSIPLFLAISPFIFYGITIGVTAFTIAYRNRARRHREDLRRQRQATASCSVQLGCDNRVEFLELDALGVR
jgi:hypothetical protein